jgi:hypothetical protein
MVPSVFTPQAWFHVPLSVVRRLAHSSGGSASLPWPLLLPPHPNGPPANTSTAAKLLTPIMHPYNMRELLAERAGFKPNSNSAQRRERAGAAVNAA